MKEIDSFLIILFILFYFLTIYDIYDIIYDIYISHKILYKNIRKVYEILIFIRNTLFNQNNFDSK